MNRSHVGIKNPNYKNGLSKHPLYAVWTDMKRRCYNANHKYYKNYGVRGIIMCNNWTNDFLSFYNWSITNGWKPGLQIDRIDNNGNYEPINCRFTTCQKNASNRQDKSKYGTGIRKIKSGKFQVTIRNKNGKRKYCGTYDTIERAQEVYRISLLAIELGKS